MTRVELPELESSFTFENQKTKKKNIESANDASRLKGKPGKVKSKELLRRAKSLKESKKILKRKGNRQVASQDILDGVILFCLDKKEEKSGWEHIFDCWSDTDIWNLIGDCDTLELALSKVAHQAGILYIN